MLLDTTGNEAILQALAFVLLGPPEPAELLHLVERPRHITLASVQEFLAFVNGQVGDQAEGLNQFRGTVGHNITRGLRRGWFQTCVVHVIRGSFLT
jgi:hypothetical protein